MKQPKFQEIFLHLGQLLSYSQKIFALYYLAVYEIFPIFATKLNAYVETEEMPLSYQSHGEEGTDDPERDQ